MLRRRPLTVVATAALLLGAGGTAFADDTLPGSDTALVEVYVPSQADVDKLAQSYDLAEYKRVEDDGRIVLNIDADPAERAALTRRRLPDRAHDRGRPHARRGQRGARGDGGAGEARRRPGRERPAAGRRQARGPVRRAAAGRDRDPARQQVHQLRRHVPLRRGAQQGDRPGRGLPTPPSPARRWRSRSPVPTASSASAANMGRFIDGDTDARRVPVPPPAGPADA